MAALVLVLAVAPAKRLVCRFHQHGDRFMHFFRAYRVVDVWIANFHISFRTELVLLIVFFVGILITHES